MVYYFQYVNKTLLKGCNLSYFNSHFRQVMLRLTSSDCFHGVDKEKDSVCTFKGVIEYLHYGGQRTEDRVSLVYHLKA